MTKKEAYPVWFLWLWDRGFLALLVGGATVLAVGLAVVYYFEQRLDQLEETLCYEPPRSYQAPDLNAYAADDVPPESVAARGVVYVPIYSHVYHDGGRPVLLEATLSIRNTDPRHGVYLPSVRYYDTEGELVEAYVDRLIRLEPLETVEFLVEVRDVRGGSGANFLVEWLATEPIEEPLIEAVMVGVSGSHTISFRSSGRALSPAAAAP